MNEVIIGRGIHTALNHCLTTIQTSRGCRRLGHHWVAIDPIVGGDVINFHRHGQRYPCEECGVAAHDSIELASIRRGHEFLAGTRGLKRGHRCPRVGREIVAIKRINRHCSDPACVVGKVTGDRGPTIGDSDRHGRSR